MVEINNAILHILDANSSIKVMADLELDINDDTVKKYLTRHIKKADNEYKLRSADFKNDSLFNKNFDEYLHEKQSFVDFSKFVAERIYEGISTSDKIHSCDIIVCRYTIDSLPKLLILKCNSKVQYVHQVYNQAGGTRNAIINHYAVLPNTTQKIDEYVLVNIVTSDVKFSGKTYYINGEDTNILGDILLECKSLIAPVETVQLITDIVESVADNNGENVSLVLSKVKSYINETMLLTDDDSPKISADKLGETVFADSEMLQQEYNEYINKEKIPNEVKVSRNLITRASKTHKIKTDTGIEIIVPSDYYQNKDVIEFINGEDGKISIQLKNIGKITNS